MSLVLNSYAKLNLFLLVHNKRKDNYHNITTIFERIDLADKVILDSRRDPKIKIICRQKGLPRNPALNLAYRSAKLLQERAGVKKGAQIRIIKRIPVGSGMGGGSSNAAIVLLGLNKLWGLRLSRKRLLGLAQDIGSDVPFFIYNASFAQGEGRGEKIKLCHNLKGVRFWHILAVPRLKVSTKFIYKKMDALKTFGLTSPARNVRILKIGLKKRNLTIISGAMFNSLQEVATRFYPQIKQIKNKLTDLGLKAIMMTGSGPAVFGMALSKKEACALGRELKKEAQPWQVFVVQTI